MSFFTEGELVTNAIAIAALIYGLAVTARISGMLYSCNRDKLSDIAPLKID